MADSFEELTKNLSAEQRAEFFRTLHEAGIDPRDRVLVRLLCVMQIYKSYYEEIPASINKSMEGIQKIKNEIESLAHHAEQSVDEGAKLVEKIMQETAQVGDSLKHMQANVEAAVGKSVELVSSRVKETLDEAVNKSIPLETLSAAEEALSSAGINIAEAGKDITEAVTESRKATAAMRNDVKVIRVTHVFSCLVASLVLILIFWGCLLYQFGQKEMEIRNAVSSEISVNQDILSTLIKTRHNFELVTDTNNPRRKLLFIKNAKGWTTLDKYGVIEFME